MFEWMLFRVIMVPFFILATSFFVAAEFALVSVRETRIQQLIANGRPGARTALKLKHTIDEFLPAVQLGVTVAGLALGWVGEPAVAQVILALAAQSLHALPAHAVVYAHTLAILIAFSLITYFEVLLGELVPKSLALQRAERIALAVAGPMDVFIRMTRPAVRLMHASAAPTGFLLPKPPPRPPPDDRPPRVGPPSLPSPPPRQRRRPLPRRAQT